METCPLFETVVFKSITGKVNVGERRMRRVAEITILNFLCGGVLGTTHELSGFIGWKPLGE